MGFAQTATNHHDLVAFLKTRVGRGCDGAGDINAADQRKLSQDAPGAGRRECVLVVDARPRATNDNVAIAKVIERDCFKARLDLAAVVGVNPECAERVDNEFCRFLRAGYWPITGRN